ncbi:DUF1937 family protein [Candidatus Pacearchaeota archaeon]|nr:DUF1937 family protein [Candidatus Pacearchaeota archaeon]
MIYLAAPYTSKIADPSSRILEQNFRAMACAEVIKHIPMIYAPLVHGYAMEHIIHKQLEPAFWLQHGLDMLTRMDSMSVIKLPGWDISEGVAMEQRKARKLGLEIDYLEPRMVIDDLALLKNLNKLNESPHS